MLITSLPTPSGPRWPCPAGHYPLLHRFCTLATILFILSLLPSSSLPGFGVCSMFPSERWHWAAPYMDPLFRRQRPTATRTTCLNNAAALIAFQPTADGDMHPLGSGWHLQTLPVESQSQLNEIIFFQPFSLKKLFSVLASVGLSSLSPI